MTDGGYTKTGAWNLQLQAKVDRLQAALDAAEKRAEAAEHANRTRPDYDLRCQDCERDHILDTVIPSAIWNQIADPSDLLCVTCISDRLAAKGLTAEAEFYYTSEALNSRLYAESYGEVQAAERRIAELEALVLANEGQLVDAPALAVEERTLREVAERALAEALAVKDTAEAQIAAMLPAIDNMSYCIFCDEDFDGGPTHKDGCIRTSLPDSAALQASRTGEDEQEDD
jgi:hypothetical protein